MRVRLAEVNLTPALSEGEGVYRRRITKKPGDEPGFCFKGDDH